MDTSQLTLWKLEIFCRVLAEKSFSRAARVLGVSQPTVSGHVGDLERLFGLRLFDRSGGDIVPTRAGELLYEQGRKLARLKEETIRVMQNLRGVVEGDVVLGGSSIPGTYLLPRLLARFKSEHPDIHITLRVGDSAEIVQAVRDGDLELGVVGSKVRGKDLRTQTFVDDELLVIAPSGHPFAELDEVTVEQLHEQPILIREHGSGTREQFVRALEAAGGPRLDSFRIVCELGSTESIKEAVRQGLGVSLVSRHALHETDPLVGRPVAGMDLRREFVIVTHERLTLSPIAKVLQDMLLTGHAVAT